MRPLLLAFALTSMNSAVCAQTPPDTVDYLTTYRVWPGELSVRQEREILALIGEYCRRVRSDLQPITPSELTWLDDNSHIQGNGIRAPNGNRIEAHEFYGSGAFNRDKIFTFLTRCMESAEAAPVGGPNLPKRWAPLAQAILDAGDLADEIQTMIRADSLPAEGWGDWKSNETSLSVMRMIFMENYLMCISDDGCTN